MYFYNDEQGDFSTLYHEATHQLFSESGAAHPALGRGADAWIIEGVACFMESLTQRDGYQTVGGIDATRIQNARFHLLRSNFYVPLAELTGLSMRDLMRQPKVAEIYAQSSALATFLMTADGGAYRDDFVRCLRMIYDGDAKSDSIARLTGADLGELDRGYKAFMVLRDQDLAAIADRANVSYLTLGGSQVTDAGLAQLSGLRALQWLDITGAEVSDAGLKHLTGLTQLQKLMVGQTRVSDTGLQQLQQSLPKLKIIR